MTVRSDVLALLDLPASRFVTTDTARTPDRIASGKVHVLVYRSRVEPAPQHALRNNELELWLLTPKQELVKGGADDDLDAALDVVLSAIDAADPLLWTVAERGVWSEEWHGYKIDLSVQTN